MAEFVLTKLAEFALSQTVQRISELLNQEAASLRSVKEDVVLLQDELGSLRGFLKGADRKKEHDPDLRDLIHRVQDVASDAENVIDTILEVPSSYIKAFHNKKIRKQISFVRKRIKVIFTCMQAYEIPSVAEDQAGTSSMAELQLILRRPSLKDDRVDDDVVILADSTRALKSELTKEEDRLCIVSVVGMGGLGKTTLAKKVYNDVKDHFDCSAFVFISQRYVLRDVLIDILTQVILSEEDMKFERSNSGTDILEQKKQIKEMLNSSKAHELIDLLKYKLEEKRFLVVLDDIWTIVAWDSLKRAFPEGRNGSKILFTTRNREVATTADPWSSPIEPRLLTLKESWQLLQRKALPRDIVDGNGCPPEYENLGKEMAKKCAGLPLAVVVLGGLLRTKATLEEWKKVMRDVNLHLNKMETRQQYEGVNEILALSYHDLPFYLKPCFLYLGNFPEDYEIHKRKLVRLWIGEGFIPMPTGSRGEMEQTWEDVGEGFLEELIHRCMVQVEKRDYTGRGVKTCRMHDLMRDLCINKAREESFARIMEKSNVWTDGSAASFEPSGDSRSRRLVIHPGVDLDRKTHWACSSFFRKLVNPCSSSLMESNWVEQVHPNLRSLLCLDGVFLPSSALKSSNFRMLRMLEVGVSVGCREFIVLRGIGNLIHLRYLCIEISGEGDLCLSSSIGNLRNLHTLRIKSDKSVRGSIGMISKLIRLRHLLLPFLWSAQNGFRIDKLKDIETLQRIPASALIRSYDALHKLTNLRNISIHVDSKQSHLGDEVRRMLGSQIVQSGRLTSLRLYIFHIAVGFPSLESLSTCHSLSKLVLQGTMKLQQGLIHLPQSLTKLTLAWSMMKQDPMPVLGNKLPNLRFLSLEYNVYVGSKMVCSAHGFPKLETLQLSNLHCIREWIVEEGAMPSLKKLRIVWLHRLERIAEGLEFVTSLKELEIVSMSNSFCRKLQVRNGIEGEDYYKVRDIPSISF